MTSFIDSHAHLADPAFDDDRAAVVDRARVTGARAIVCIGESLAAAERAAVVASENAGFCYYSAGVHPHDAAHFTESSDIASIREHVAKGAVAIGECGLDAHYDHSPMHLQRKAFRAQLALAQELGKPVVVHTREAESETGAMIRESSAIGVLHCYTGTQSLAKVALDAGWVISFSGIITFKKWTDDALLRFVPEDRLMVESDSPYLAPVPHRGKRNEPAWVSLTLAKLALVRGVAASDLGHATVRNTCRFFSLPEH